MSIELTLVFNDPGALLSPPNDGMEGQLILGTAENSPYVKFTPVETSTSAGNVIYDVTFSNFNGLSPNNIWGLDLWDNNATHQGNTLISWSLTVEVPEPVDVALVVFGLMFTAILVTRRCRAKKLPAPAHPQHSI
jgi:hypothetical protein